MCVDSSFIQDNYVNFLPLVCFANSGQSLLKCSTDPQILHPPPAKWETMEGRDSLQEATFMHTHMTHLPGGGGGGEGGSNNF